MNILYYLPTINRFVDINENEIMHDLQPLFHLWEIDKWARGRKTGVLVDHDGYEWVLMYLDPDDEDEIIELIDHSQSIGLDYKVYRLRRN